MKYADLPKQRINHLVKPDNLSLEDWQVMLRMQQASHEQFEVECVSERYSPGEYRVTSPSSGNSYKVVYRGPKSPWNYCDCMDFKTSQLGTCKHIEAARQWIADHHKRIHRDLPAYTSVYLSYRGNDRRVKIRIGSIQEAEFRKLSKAYFNDFEELLPASYEKFGAFLSAAKSLDDSFRCYKDALDYVLEQRERIRRTKVVKEQYDDDALDHLLRVSLYPYQREGVRFCAQAGRAILADEMGLGKTVQAIATAELLLREKFIGQVVVLCPTTLKYQWKREIERFTSASVQLIEGTPEQRREQLSSDAVYKIASYHSINQDLKELETWETDMIIMDEVQRLKNWNTQISRSVRRIHSRYSLILSGTPLENRLEELYSVVELVDQYLLSPYYLFRDRYLQLDDTGRTIGYRHLTEIRQRLSGVMLRRRKEDVALQLPARIDKNLFVPMTNEQLEAHHDLKLHAARLVSKWHRQHFLSEIDRKQLLLTLQQMRMSCDSLYVLDEHSRFDTKVEETMNILNECGVTVDGERQKPESNLSTLQHFNALPPKVVIFSQWERMTRLVALELERSGVGFVYLHGSVPSSERKERIEQFQRDPDILVFLSTDAGATGLNLQMAQVVINLDLPWNPTLLEQRVGRIHRIGQTHNIEVINLIAAGTIEEDLLSKLRFKTALFEGVLDGGEDAVFLSDDRFEGLLDSLHEYMEDSDLQTNFQEVVQTELSFEEPLSSSDVAGEVSPAPALTNIVTADSSSQLLRSIAKLLQADETTRRELSSILIEMAEKITQKHHIQ